MDLSLLAKFEYMCSCMTTYDADPNTVIIHSSTASTQVNQTNVRNNTPPNSMTRVPQANSSSTKRTIQQNQPVKYLLKDQLLLHDNLKQQPQRKKRKTEDNADANDDHNNNNNDDDDDNKDTDNNESTKFETFQEYD